MASKDDDNLVEREKERLKRETEFVNRRVAIAKRKILQVLDSAKGKSILRAEAKRQKAARAARSKALKSLPKEQRRLQKLRNTFEIYDIDGSNTIDVGEFKSMLLDLCIPIADADVSKTFDSIDTDGSGEIEFEEFRKWYDSEGEGLGKRSRLAQLRLRASKRASLVSGGIDLRRARRSLIKEALSHAAEDAQTMFREQNPPLCDLEDMMGAAEARDAEMKSHEKELPEMPDSVRSVRARSARIPIIPLPLSLKFLTQII